MEGKPIPVVSGRGIYAKGRVANRVRRARVRQIVPVPRSDPPVHRHISGSQPLRSSDMSLLLINARSVHNKSPIIHDLIVDKATDLACITETWVGAEGGASLTQLCPPGYTVQHLGRLEERGGGVAIVYRESLYISRTAALVSSGLECLHLSVGLRDRFGIVLVYRAPRDPALSLPELSEFISAALLRSPRLLVVGDFNVHAESGLSGAALEFMESMASMNLSQHITVPTHRAGHSLDLVFSSSSADSDLRVGNIKSLPVSWSDHYLLTFSLSIVAPLRGENGPTIWARPRRLLDPERFLEVFGGFSDGLAGDPVEAQVERWYQEATRAVDLIAPKRLLRCRVHSSPWYTAELRAMKQERRRLERRWRKDQSDINRAAVSMLTRRYVKAIRSAKKSYYTQRIGGAANQQAELFRVVRDLTNPGQQRPPPSGFTSELFAAHFRTKIEAIRSDLDSGCSGFNPAISPAAPPRSPQFVHFESVTTEDISRALVRCKPAASPFDPCPSWLIRTAGGSMVEWAKAIVNASFRDGILPSRLKETIIKPIPKKLNILDDLSNYRPIANIPYMGKVIERVAAEQLQVFLEDGNLLDPFQSGFRPRRGTETVLVALQDDLLRRADRGCSSLLVLLDLSAAFDTVDHGILLSRLSEMGIGGSAWCWFQSFLEGRAQRVKLGDEMSAPWTLSCGVPQGSAISPMLFNIYLKPLGEVIRRFGVCCHQYADDTQLYLSFTTSAVEAVQTLERCLAAVMEWTRMNRLKLNPDKTEVLFLGGTSEKYGGPLPSLDGMFLQLAERVRNLGMVLDPALSWDSQIAAVSKSAFYQLRLIAQIRPFLDVTSLRAVVHALVISRIDYCNALYMGLPLNLIRRLQQVQNAAARLVVGASKYDRITPILARLHWLPVASRIRFKVMVLTYKTLHGLGPEYMTERLSLRPTNARPTRSSSAMALRVATPRETRKALTRNRAFSVAAPSLWNKLPADIRLSPSVAMFKKSLKTLLYREAFGNVVD